MLLIFIISINYVSAEEYPEVTSDSEVRYKWYKETITGGYYSPIKSITRNDIVDISNIRYVGPKNVYSAANCSLPSEYYLLEEIIIRDYKKVNDASYVLIENIKFDNNIKIYFNQQPINYSIIEQKENQVKINLRTPYLCDKLLFFVDVDTEYTISLYKDSGFKKQIISKTIENEKISIPDKSWITDKTEFISDSTSVVEYEESDLTKLIRETVNCSAREKYVYKYDVTKEYYDDNYHLSVDGYIKDVSDYKIYYKGKPITNTIEIIQEKIVEVPKIQYVYIENEIQKNDSSQPLECKDKVITETVYETKTEIVEKEIPKIPKKIYIVIAMLILLILGLLIKIYIKYVE